MSNIRKMTQIKDPPRPSLVNGLHLSLFSFLKKIKARKMNSTGARGFQGQHSTGWLRSHSRRVDEFSRCLRRKSKESRI